MEKLLIIKYLREYNNNVAVVGLVAVGVGLTIPGAQIAAPIGAYIGATSIITDLGLGVAETIVISKNQGHFEGRPLFKSFISAGVSYFGGKIVAKTVTGFNVIKNSAGRFIDEVSKRYTSKAISKASIFIEEGFGGILGDTSNKMFNYFIK